MNVVKCFLLSAVVIACCVGCASKSTQGSSIAEELVSEPAFEAESALPATESKLSDKREAIAQSQRNLEEGEASQPPNEGSRPTEIMTDADDVLQSEVSYSGGEAKHKDSDNHSHASDLAALDLAPLEDTLASSGSGTGEESGLAPAENNEQAEGMLQAEANLPVAENGFKGGNELDNTQAEDTSADTSESELAETPNESGFAEFDETQPDDTHLGDAQFADTEFEASDTEFKESDTDLADSGLDDSDFDDFEADEEKNRDPFEKLNRVTFAFNDFFDVYLLKPAAKTYKFLAPGPVELGVHNFFSNLLELRNVVNDLAQAKWARAGKDSTRFIVNSTLGIAGLFDVAKEFGIERADGEDFGQTLRVWGIPDGPYIVIPFLGPFTATDIVAYPVDWLSSPLAYAEPSVEKNAVLILRDLERRAQLLESEEIITGDKYTFIREAYLQNRDFKAKDGVVEDDFGGDLDDFDDF